eukprot:TRINITY_DN4198_c0_g1_i1.p1 TRINITY_DN4198_c0_g1~~TRINITY_DN4198_c0_g1_i1.p1  ORF type:complete len:729 (+),score=199.25 TRINITY_DN4198_c0_g1_i1:46-2232(+)
MPPLLAKMAGVVGLATAIEGRSVQNAIEAYDSLLPSMQDMSEAELNELFRFHMKCLVSLGRPTGGTDTASLAGLADGSALWFMLWWAVSSLFYVFMTLGAVALGVYYLRRKYTEQVDLNKTRTIYRPPPKVVSIMTKDRKEALALIKASSIVSTEEDYMREKLTDAETTARNALQYRLKEKLQTISMLRPPTIRMQSIYRGNKERMLIKKRISSILTLQRVFRSFLARKELNARKEEASAPITPLIPAIPVIPVIPVIAVGAVTPPALHTFDLDDDDDDDDDYLLHSVRSLGETFGSILTDPVGSVSIQELSGMETEGTTDLSATDVSMDDDVEEAAVAQAFAEQFTSSPVDLTTPKKDPAKPQRRFTSASTAKKDLSARRFTTPGQVGRKPSRRPSEAVHRPSGKTPLTARRGSMATPLTARRGSMARRGSTVVPKTERMEEEEKKTRDKVRFLYLGERHTIEANFKKGKRKIQDAEQVVNLYNPPKHKEYRATFNTFSRLADTSTKSVSMKKRRNKEEKETKAKKPKPKTERLLKSLVNNRRSSVAFEDEEPTVMAFCRTAPPSITELSLSDEESDNACFLDGTVTPPVKCNRVELIIPCEPPTCTALDGMSEAVASVLMDDTEGVHPRRDRRFSITLNNIPEEDSKDLVNIGAVIDQLETPRRRQSTGPADTLQGKVERLLALARTTSSNVPLHDLEVAIASKNVSGVLNCLNFSDFHASPPRHL